MGLRLTNGRGYVLVNTGDIWASRRENDNAQPQFSMIGDHGDPYMCFWISNKNHLHVTKLGKLQE